MQTHAAIIGHIADSTVGHEKRYPAKLIALAVIKSHIADSTTGIVGHEKHCPGQVLAAANVNAVNKKQANLQ